MESKIEFLKKMESKAAAGETKNVDDTLTAVNNVARETFETVEKTMREFGDQQTDVTRSGVGTHAATCPSGIDQMRTCKRGAGRACGRACVCTTLYMFAQTGGRETRQPS